MAQCDRKRAEKNCESVHHDPIQPSIAGANEKQITEIKTS